MKMTPAPAALTGARYGRKIVVMAKNPRKVAGRKDGSSRVVAAAEFKTTCLELMDRVRETGVEYVVTKHGQPVAMLVPYDGAPRSALFGALKGTVLKYDRPFDPVEGDYDIDQA